MGSNRGSEHGCGALFGFRGIEAQRSLDSCNGGDRRGAVGSGSDDGKVGTRGPVKRSGWVQFRWQ